MRKKKILRSGRAASPRRARAKKSTRIAVAEAVGVHRLFPIVAIGASAGGFEAMAQMLKSLPARTGMAFVLVQHLDPTHESALTLLLSRLTPMPVTEAVNNLPLRPNHVYVIPPNKLMGVSGRRLKVSPRKIVESHLPIDQFFRSLAEEEGKWAIGVILSGNGADGTQGLLAIKAAGGITFAQDGKSAKYPGMPASAIAAGCVDFVLSPERIARELGMIAGHPYIAPGGAAAEDEEEEEKAVDREQAAEENVYGEILAILRQRMAVDFTHYKHATLRRRIHRRMALRKMESLREYAGHLRANTDEVHELFNDILIHVTNFFRDPAVFQDLKKKVFPRFFKDKSPEDPIRVWVPGCSTGEEAYSIAISLVEFMSDRKINRHVQIFGTDINESALAKCRVGAYPESIKADLSNERLRRFFTRTEGGYRISKPIREMCIFARQNVVLDPPFSNLDLISCRNMLIYLGMALQRAVVPRFHYALKPTGFLLLGASETVGSFSDLFALLDKKTKIYAKKATPLRAPVAFGHRTAAEPGAPAESPHLAAPVGPTMADVQKQAERILLTHYSPASVVINPNMEVLQFRGHTGPFLEHAHGEASLNLLKMVREDLILSLRTSVAKAIKQNVRVRQRPIRIKQDGHSLHVGIEVIPFGVPPASERFFIVLFHSLAAPEALEDMKPHGKKAPGRPAAEAVEVSRLREELTATRESLRSIIEKQEVTMEELRSANEEIMSSNEELQSTNEELETAKEELQSTNEELTTLNDELESRNAELEDVNNDLHNVLSSVSIPIIILGPDLRIRRFTGIAEKLFNLIPGDVGRPITDINLPFGLPHLSKLVLEVIDHLTIKEMEVQDRGGHWWSVRIRPYKTTENKIDGAVIAIVDIDLIKISAQQISKGRAFADALINTLRRPVLLLDHNLAVLAANQAFYHDFQVTPDETLHRRVFMLGDGQWNMPKLRTLLEEILPHNSSFKDFEVEHNFPHIGRKKMLLEARRLAVQDDQQHMILLTIGEPDEKQSQ